MYAYTLIQHYYLIVIVTIPTIIICIIIMLLHHIILPYIILYSIWSGYLRGAPGPSNNLILVHKYRSK